jgi:hypothetical protein
LGRQPRSGIGREAACCLDGEDHEAHTTGMWRGLGPSSLAATMGGGAVGIDVGAAAATAIGGGGGQPIGEDEARRLGLGLGFVGFGFVPNTSGPDRRGAETKIERRGLVPYRG